MATTTAYLIVEPVWGSSAYNAERLMGMKVVRLVQKKPKNFRGVAVKLTLNIPDGAFKPLSPEVTIDVPAEALDYEPTVEVNFPEDDG